MTPDEDICAIKNINQQWSNLTPAARSERSADEFEERPHLLLMFLKECKAKMDAGVTRCAPGVIANDLRESPNIGGGYFFKLNNNFTTRLAHLAISIEPALEPFLKMRAEPIKSNPNNRFDEQDRSHFLRLCINKKKVVAVAKAWRRMHPR